MATCCTCLPEGPRDPQCPVAPAHEAMDTFVGNVRSMVADFTALTEEAQAKILGATDRLA